MPGQDKPAINALTSLGLLGAGHPLWAIGAATATLQNPRAMANLAQGTARAIPEIAGKVPTIASQLTGVELPHGLHSTAERAIEQGVHHAGETLHQNMGETKPTSQSIPQKSPMNSPTSLNVNHPALAPWKATFDKNAATAKDAGEAQKSQAVTDFVLSQRDPAYAAAKQKASDEPVAENSQDNLRMAEGGIVPMDKRELIEEHESLVENLKPAAEEKEKQEAELKKMRGYNKEGTVSRAKDRPFNTDMADKLGEFLRKKGENDAKPR